MCEWLQTIFMTLLMLNVYEIGSLNISNQENALMISKNI